MDILEGPRDIWMSQNLLGLLIELELEIILEIYGPPHDKACYLESMIITLQPLT
jgi:hypothetical protein